MHVRSYLCSNSQEYSIELISEITDILTKVYSIDKHELKMTESIIIDLLDRMTESRSEAECRELGFVEAQYLLGELYGNKNDKKLAVKWLKKAAKQGHVKAQYKLSYIYNYGRGVRKDDKQAIKWCRKAAEQGYASAQLELGHQYSYGVSLSKDLLKAANWYTKAAKQGSASAQLSLAELYEGGWGVEQDYPRAYSLFNAAAINGDDESALFRDKLEEKMSTDQITEAKALELIWQSNKVSDGV